MLQATADPITNREDWIQQIEVRDQNNIKVDLTGATIVLAVNERQSKQLKLLAQTADNTIVIQAIGIFQFTFTLAQMRGLDASKAYEMGCTILLNGVTRTLFVGSVPVIDGIVP